VDRHDRVGAGHGFGRENSESDGWGVTGVAPDA
jgi:hypothetical protein